MNDWFECRVSYDKTTEDGQVKHVTEDYLVEATGFTEAEKRITEKMLPYISGDFTVGAIRRRNYEAVLENTEGNYYYRVKLTIIIIDEKTAKEKQSNMFLLVYDDDLVTAIASVHDYMRSSMEDWNYHTVTETAILDVFRYDE